MMGEPLAAMAIAARNRDSMANTEPSAKRGCKTHCPQHTAGETEPSDSKLGSRPPCCAGACRSSPRSNTPRRTAHRNYRRTYETNAPPSRDRNGKSSVLDQWLPERLRPRQTAGVSSADSWSPGPRLPALRIPAFAGSSPIPLGRSGASIPARDPCKTLGSESGLEMIHQVPF